MRKVLRRPRFWLVLGWKATMRRVHDTPPGHLARPYLLAAGRKAEDWYWRQMHLDLHSPRRIRPKWTKG